MGEYKTQTREPLPPVRYYVQSRNNTWPNAQRGRWDLVPRDEILGWRATQTTRSWRTGFHESPVDPTSREAQLAFADVTGNGLAGESTFSNRRYSRYDNGHPFYTTKTWMRCSHPSWEYTWPSTLVGYTMGYKGPLIPRISNSPGFPVDFPAETKMSDNDIKVYGTRGVNRAIPSQPGFDLATFLGELFKEGLPSILGLDFLKNETSKARALGGEYLNVEFGWMPLIRGVRDLITQLKGANNVIRQFERDGGRMVRRTVPIETVVDTSMPTPLSGWSGPNLYGFQSNGNYTNAFNTQAGGSVPGPVFRETNSVKKYVFKGAFEYAVIEGNTFGDKLAAYEQKANILLGTRVTPEVLWNLAPWSWLSDWCLNIGDVLANATYLSSDGLVMRYGYLMCHTVAYNRISIPAGATFYGGTKTGPIWTLYGRETKERVRATPYGFGLNPDSFSIKQWAILGALGLTRAPGRLP